jgi:hypothetical protein
MSTKDIKGDPGAPRGRWAPRSHVPS